jgi:prevent-host-death family protein
MTSLISISDARASLPDLVNKVNNRMDRVIITVNGQPKATLISAEELESLEETAEVLAIPGAKRSILEGMKQAKKSQGVLLTDLE